MPGFLLPLIVSLIIIGLVLYVAKLLPIDPAIKQIITAVVIVAVVIWLLYALLGGGMVGMHWPCR